jgi:hypothetical protein
MTSSSAVAGVPGSGVPTSGVPTSGVPTSGVPTSGVPTSGQVNAEVVAAHLAQVVGSRLVEVRERIDRARPGGGEVRIVAVTKGFGPEVVEAAMQAGLLDIGENYAQDLLWKCALVAGSARWHFLGELQRNKLSRLAPHVHLWHGLDSAPQALALARRSPGAAVLVEVRTDGGPRRHGAGIETVPALVSYATDVGLDVHGLMTIGPREAPPESLRRCFGEVARLAQSLGLAEVSMGMSADFELAVAEGATIVRLGTALFGERPPAGPAGRGAATLR